MRLQQIRFYFQIFYSVYTRTECSLCEILLHRFYDCTELKDLLGILHNVRPPVYYLLVVYSVCQNNVPIAALPNPAKTLISIKMEHIYGNDYNEINALLASHRTAGCKTHV